MTISCNVFLAKASITPEQLAENQRLADASSLPSDLFASHPDVVQLTAAAGRWGVRRKLLETTPKAYLTRCAAAAYTATPLFRRKQPGLCKYPSLEVVGPDQPTADVGFKLAVTACW